MKLGDVVISLSRFLAFIVLAMLVSTFTSCNSNEITQNVEVTITESDADPQEPAGNDTLNPLLIVGGGMAIVIIGFLAMVGFSFYFHVPIRVVVMTVLVLAILVVTIGILLPTAPA